MRRIELLAPGGDVDSIKAAIAAGADAVYCGVNKFNARNRASNIDFGDLNGILRLAHSNSCKVFMTLNIIIVESEIPELLRLLNRLANTSIDGVIVQDPGLLYLLSLYYKGIDIHASTQLNTHNEGQIKFLNKLNVSRMNLSRELNIEEIESMSAAGHKHGILTEVFIHGSYCISFSGLCYMSSVQGGNSGNRGRCSQPCRERYVRTPAGRDYPLNLKDNSAWFDLKELAKAGVDSFKIEGRIKKYHYVYTVVEAYRKQMQRLHEGKSLSKDNTSLQTTFNRDFSAGFLKGNISRDMFTDNPRDQSTTDQDEFKRMKSKIKNRIDLLSIARAPLKISVSGQMNEVLRLEVTTPETTFVVASEMKLLSGSKFSLDEKELLKRFKAFNDTEYFLEHLDLAKLQPGLHIPFSELSSMKNSILFLLMNSKKPVEALKLPALKRSMETAPPSLSVLISSKNDLKLCENSKAEICFQLPDSLSGNLSDFVDLFKKYRSLTPWFPPVIIGEDYNAALKFLESIRPKQIVTNNTGIAYEASKMGCSWIAGPFMNLANSYSLICLKEKFNCSGAFITNEISRQQIRGIRKPENFSLYYSIYHPVEMMTSRQCFFHQITGCEKYEIDEKCMQDCDKRASITNMKNTSLFIEKTRGSYNRIYHETHYLNTSIVNDLPDVFSGFLIDLRDVKTLTRQKTDKDETIALFENHLLGDTEATLQLRKLIHPITDLQYKAGI